MPIYEIVGYDKDYDTHTVYYKTQDKSDAYHIAEVFKNNIDNLFTVHHDYDGIQKEPVDWIEIWKDNIREAVLS